MSLFRFPLTTADGPLVGNGRRKEYGRCCGYSDCLVDVLVSLPKKNRVCKASLYLVAFTDKMF